MRSLHKFRLSILTPAQFTTPSLLLVSYKRIPPGLDVEDGRGIGGDVGAGETGEVLRAWDC